METVDICSTEEFKDDPTCKKKRGKWTLCQNIFWMIVLVVIMFFSTTWMQFIDRILDNIFGNRRSNYVLGGLALGSLVMVLILAHFFDVDLEY
jgi:hypothetical protein